MVLWDSDEGLNDTNIITGVLPSEVGNMESLRELVLDNQNVTGTIPPQIANMASLEVLRLDMNYIDGPLPPAFPSSLIELRAEENYITGTLSPALGNLVALEDFRVYKNAMNGPVPTELAQLSNLQILYLDGNNFEGSLDHMCPLRESGSLEELAADCKEGGKIACSCCSDCY